MENFMYFLKLGWGEIYSIFSSTKSKEKPKKFKRERIRVQKNTGNIIQKTKRQFLMTF